MTGQRGVALVIVLWVTMLLALMAESFLAEVRTDTLLARNLVDNGEAQALADGAIHQTIVRLLQQRQNNDAYFDGQPTTMTSDAGTVEISVQDESGRVNLNSAPDALIEAVFLSAGIEIGQAKSMADRIADWRDSDHLRRLNGAEDSDYRAANLSYGAKDRPFTSVRELQMVLGITPDLYARVAPALTVYADKRGVDLRAAPKAVLQALMDNNDARVNVFLDARQQQDAAALNDAMQSFGVSRRFVSSSSRSVFTIRAKARTKSGALFDREAVVWLASSQTQPFTILAWRKGRYRSPGAD